MFGKSKAFTLVEIVIVTVLIGIMFVLFIPNISFVTDKAKETIVKTDLNSYRNAICTAMFETVGFRKVSSKDEAIRYININLDTNFKIDSDYKISRKDPWESSYSIKFSDDMQEVLVKSNGMDNITSDNDLEVICVWQSGKVKSAFAGFKGNNHGNELTEEEIDAILNSI